MGLANQWILTDFNTDADMYLSNNAIVLVTVSGPNELTLALAKKLRAKYCRLNKNRKFRKKHTNKILTSTQTYFNKIIKLCIFPKYVALCDHLGTAHFVVKYPNDNNN